MNKETVKFQWEGNLLMRILDTEVGQYCTHPLTYLTLKTGLDGSTKITVSDKRYEIVYGTRTKKKIDRKVTICASDIAMDWDGYYWEFVSFKSKMHIARIAPPSPDYINIRPPSVKKKDLTHLQEVISDSDFKNIK